MSARIVWPYRDLTLYRGDCLQVMKGIPDSSVKLVITDPPYTMTKTGNSCRPNYMPGGEILNCNVPDVDLWFFEVYRILQDNAHFYTFVNINDLHSYLNSALKNKFRLHNILHMIKDTKMPNRYYLKYTEIVLFFRKGKAFPIHDMTSRDYINVNMPTIKNGKIHPTEKPLSFIEKLVTNSSNVGDFVFDPFMGSGTTGVACVNLGRKFVGIEKDIKYFKVAKKRIKNANN